MDTSANNDKKHKRRKFKTKKQKKLERVNRTDDRDTNPRKNYSEIIKKNENFEDYYRNQKIIESDEEFAEFLKVLAEPLPTTFRISSFCQGQAQRMRDIIQSDYIKDFQSGNTELIDGKKLDISPIPWYPNKLAWTINLTKTEIRKSRTINLLHKFLICETETGDISRQEAVSMIPPLLLDIKPGQAVLDMCAAPGSKTAQIIEMLHQESGSTFISGDCKQNDVKYLDGLVVANDVDNRRCYMLAHQSKRLSSSCVVITNHDAANLPNFYKNDPVKGKTVLKFDRVLADVLCSGDGTFRKNYDVWTKWSAGNANNLHNIQIKIAKRGLELLAKDGIMAYSTCSLNPVENEAIVAALLNMAEGDLELVDASSFLPELKCYPGIDNWIVMDKDNHIVASPKEVPEKYLPQIRKTHFPPSNAAELNLKYCMRIMPHYQNTGGFFIALIRKKTDILCWEKESEGSSEKKNDEQQTNTNDDDNNNNNNNNKKSNLDKKNKYTGFREEPFYFLDENDEDWIALKSYFKFPVEFTANQLAHRCVQGKRRNIYYMTEKAADFIRMNKDMKIISGGVRVFNRTDVNHVCPYRITQEGIPSIFPYFIANLESFLPNNDEKSFTIVEVELDFFIELLKRQDIKVEQLDQPTQTMLSEIPSGCFIMYVRIRQDWNSEKSPKFILPMCVWRGKSLLRAYVAKNDRSHLLRLCGYEPISAETTIVKGENKRSLDIDDDDDGCDNQKEFKNDDDDNIGMEKTNGNNQNHSCVEKRTKLDCHDDDDDGDNNGCNNKL
ncbi:tRNA (cytosine(34)-C(5))-methyltransferase [Dermatophagoides pteronyssinus]|uniref:tRNA (cytosine(34)-C(5))-methyltransferase n=1 Tax=Dermatophagoides pteronyssinus TaxID=6956 RepID=A0ABQ8IXI7_DERPT|nr:tRNA (cytosine(34)-C(5))-methyltransferase [Dermatophagoides pteronyssinus]